MACTVRQQHGVHAASEAASSCGREYFRKAADQLRATRGDAEQLAAIAREAAGALLAGRRVYANIVVGHMPSRELDNGRAGNPAQFDFIPTSAAAAEAPPAFERIAAGDVLLTCKVDSAVRAARERGAYVAVFTCHRVNHRGTPPGEVTWNSNAERLMPADVGSTVVESAIPWEQGLAALPEVPEFPVLPASSNVLCAQVRKTRWPRSWANFSHL
jgi:hypothetical protein